MDSKILNALIIKAIEQNDQKGLESYLQRIPFAEITPSSFYESLERYLEIAAYNGNDEGARTIMKSFEETNLLNDRIPLFSELFRHPEFSEEVLKFLVPIFDDTTFYEHMANLIEYDDDDLAVFAAARLVRLYRQLDLKGYKDLEAVAKEQKNQNMFEFIRTIIQEISPSAPKPKWVRNYMGETVPTELEVWNTLPPPQEVAFHLPGIEASVELLTEGLQAQGELDFNIEESKRFLTQLLSTAPIDDRLEYLKPIFTAENRVNLKDDQHLFRVLGPVNAVIDADLASNHICSKYGGDRMFTCLEFETVDVEDDDEYFANDWFTGSCQQCDLRIDNRYWAVRQPLPAGGWKGCYCSWQCVREEILIPTCVDIEKCPIRQELENDPNLAMQAIISRVEANMKRIGIQDRRVIGEFDGTEPKKVNEDEDDEDEIKIEGLRIDEAEIEDEYEDDE
jgi:hypothetical protein